MNEQNIKIIKTIFDNKSSIDIFIPYIICTIFIVITIYYIVRINLTLSKSNWEKNKCVPKYMFLSGFIQKEPGLNVLGSISKNFKQCIKDGMIANKNKNKPYLLPDPVASDGSIPVSGLPLDLPDRAPI
jgi:hypothetical protein